ncbi:sulfite exporter TauE/SafE family protein [Stigmatella sp. ncwal1]|uniref:Probable membrane transporter protein n=1 Tax=Stigmatella ashevillensis TaxID=2995309 RepID=A0ABT5D270_9BACT|nr:sulfite exporter TauE/SafE family protein [Stigmatella ashevillena]MDC0707755.1 sulfite exporter TauE/SafE family protein [Stigmatella ashevillena]
MTLAQGLVLLLASFGAGVLKAVAGGGTFLIFPALMSTGVDPIRANATSTVALWPGDVASALAYRREMEGQGRLAASLGVASLLGGAVGAILLLNSSRATFSALVPAMLLMATLLFTFGGPLLARLRGGGPGAEDRTLPLGVSLVLQFLVSIYGGYFGAGLGILMLALFSVMGLKNIHKANALKSVLGVLLNGLVTAIFVSADAIAWEHGALVTAGTTSGSFLGAAVARKLNPDRVRAFVGATAWVLTGYYFWRAA